MNFLGSVPRQPRHVARSPRQSRSSGSVLLAAGREVPKKVPGLIEDFLPWLPQGQVLGAWLLVAVAMRLARARELEASEAGDSLPAGILGGGGVFSRPAPERLRRSNKRGRTIRQRKREQRSVVPRHFKEGSVSSQS